MADAYRAFLEAKVELAQPSGFDTPVEALHDWLKPHAKQAVRWMLGGGRRAVFASFGLHKTSMQLEACWRALQKLWGDGEEMARGLIVVPLGVRQEFARDAAQLGIPIRFVRSTVECWAPGLYVTNYESAREEKIDLSGFDVVSLDEAACLRGMGGTKTFRVFANALGNVRFRFVATATPSPNEYIELLAYSEVLGVMDVGQAKTRFFRRNSEKADQLTLHPHKEREFWMWVASWALFITKPSDLGCDDAGYQLPTMQVRWHEVPAGADEARVGPGQQLEMFAAGKVGVADQARVKRSTLIARVAKMAQICAADPDAHRILWHDLNDERDLISEALPEAFVLDGSQDDETKEQRLLGFSDGFFQYLAAKPVMAGAGCNFQRHCRKAVFVGIGFKFHDFIQAIHRIHRFGQTGVVEIDVIYAESERAVREELERKWSQHNEMVSKMAEIIREYGLSSAAMADQLRRSLGVERVEARGRPDPRFEGMSSPWGATMGERYWLVNNDCVEECRRMASDSVDLIVTSIPFSTQYEYSPNYCFDAETQVLTKRGWIGFAELSLQDDVATVNQDDLKLEWQRPLRTVDRPYRGPMLHFRNGNNFDLLVTPDHQLFVDARVGNHRTGRKTKEYRRVRAGDVAAGFVVRKWRMINAPEPGEGVRPATIAVPQREISGRGPVPKMIAELSAEDFMALAGWYVSEGYCDPVDGVHGGRITIAQTNANPGFREEIAALFARIGLGVQRQSRAIVAHNKSIAAFLIDQFGTGSHQKRLPAWLFDLHPDLLMVLRDTMMKGDGCKTGFAYGSVSPRLRDDFQTLCVLTGWRSSVLGDVVQIGRRQRFPEIRRPPEVVEYEGRVGCATVPNGTLVVRRRGVVSVSGNCDFGHTDDNDHFWRQMGFLIPELLRVLKPGRDACIHVKDRIVPGGLTGLGFQTLQPFGDEARYHFRRGGFAYLGTITNVTDVVRENNQTYRLGHTEQLKDGTRMGVGVPEQIILLRKPPSDLSDGYADVPVVKHRPQYQDEAGLPAPYDRQAEQEGKIRPMPGTGYSRGRWQLDAHAYWRSSGDRLLKPEEWLTFENMDEAYKLWRGFNLDQVYDYEQHVLIGERFDAIGKLPAIFQLLPPHSWHADVWTDVAQMRSLNSEAGRKGQEKHLCPLPFDIVERLIRQRSNPGELVFDPFAGLGTTPYCALKLGRRGAGVELSPDYFVSAAKNLALAEEESRPVPTLFDAVEAGVAA